ncbi:MAG: exonuclease domain-containing protein, partial [Candidatus Aminicenantes bacterium]
MAQNCKLRDLEVLVLDCQATHSDPVKGKIFEIAWIRTKASETFPKEEQAESHLVAFKDNEDLPRYISKITGILPGDFRFAIPAEDAWKRLQKSAQAAASENKAVLCPTIIHYSRYEEPFLRKLHREFCLETQFPFRIICTHQIVKQLLPGLPRKGLRAMCGYFGHPQPDARRSRNHVLGTAFIWAHLVSILEEQKKCLTLDDLICFLERPLSHPDRLNPVRVYPMAENFRKNTPDSPGLYRMFRSNGDLLYIGKAKSLKRRIADYFQKKGKHSEHILEMLSQAKSLSYSLTQTVFEAALRESDEIKALSPSYNIALRSSEGGPFFATTDLQSCRQKPDSLHRIGPLPSQKHIASLSSLMAIINGSCGRITPQVTAKALAA